MKSSCSSAAEVGGKLPTPNRLYFIDAYLKQFSFISIVLQSQFFLLCISSGLPSKDVDFEIRSLEGKRIILN